MELGCNISCDSSEIKRSKPNDQDFIYGHNSILNEENVCVLMKIGEATR